MFKSVLQTLRNTRYTMPPPRLPLPPNPRVHISSHCRLNRRTYNVTQSKICRHLPWGEHGCTSPSRVESFLILSTGKVMRSAMSVSPVVSTLSLEQIDRRPSFFVLVWFLATAHRKSKIKTHKSRSEVNTKKIKSVCATRRSAGDGRSSRFSL